MGMLCQSSSIKIANSRRTFFGVERDGALQKVVVTVVDAGVVLKIALEKERMTSGFVISTSQEERILAVDIEGLILRKLTLCLVQQVSNQGVSLSCRRAEARMRANSMEANGNRRKSEEWSRVSERRCSKLIISDVLKEVSFIFDRRCMVH